ncbi:MAG: S8 family peptidase [Burkholderiaceae bacterium]
MTRSGDYFISVRLFDDIVGWSNGGSLYQMRIGAPGANTACRNQTAVNAGIVPGQVVAIGQRSTQAAGRPARGKSLVMQQPVLIKGSAAIDRPALLGVPRDLGQGGASALGKAPTTWQPSLGHQGIGPGETDSVLRTILYAKALAGSGQWSAVFENFTMQALQAAAPSFVPNDREYPKQRWHYDAIELPAALGLAAQRAGDARVAPVVAVLDTGVVIDHPDLAGQLEPGFDFITDPARAGDGDGIDANADDSSISVGSSFHGTHVAGTIAARSNNAIGGIGVAPMARIMPVRVLTDRGATSFYDIDQGIRFAAGLSNDSGVIPTRPASVINLSLGAGRACSSSDANYFQDLQARGITVVVASGNDSSASRLQPIGFPANCPGVIAVGATDAQFKRAYYSNGGAELTLVAPGGDQRVSTTGTGLPDGVFSTMATISGGRRQPTYASLQGTSMATPHVSGIVALMKYLDPTLTPIRIDALIRSGEIVDDLGPVGRDSETGFGQLNARKAAQAAIRSAGGTGTPAPLPGRIEAFPSMLALGALRESIDFELRRVGEPSTRVVRLASDSPAVVVAPLGSAVDPVSGLGTYRVSARRNLMAPGQAVFATITVELTVGDAVRVPVSVERRASGAGTGSLGPVYLLVIDQDAVDAGAPDTVAAEVPLAAPLNGAYEYTATVPGASRIVLYAGTDNDNDLLICSRGEACGGYPVLSDRDRVLSPRGDLERIDFELAPFGGINAQSLSAGGPRRGPGK